MMYGLWGVVFYNVRYISSNAHIGIRKSDRKLYAYGMMGAMAMLCLLGVRLIDKWYLSAMR